MDDTETTTPAPEATPTPEATPADVVPDVAPEEATPADVPTDDEDVVLEPTELVSRIAPAPALQMSGYLPLESALVIN